MIIERWQIGVVGLILIELLADTFGKSYSISGKSWQYVSALACFIICNVFWLDALRSGSGLARGGTLFCILASLGVVLIGVLGYKEPFSKYQILGAFLGIVSIYFLNKS